MSVLLEGQDLIVRGGGRLVDFSDAALAMGPSLVRFSGE